jgi:hypothetical protein
MRFDSVRLLTCVGLLAFGAGGARAGDPAAMNPVAEAYVKLALAAGVHDGDFVDAYQGPAEWKTAAEKEKLPLAEIRRQAQALGATLAAMDVRQCDELHQLRHEYLTKQLRAMDARLALVEGRKLPFDEESALLFDTIAPAHSFEHYEKLLAELDRALPGEGSLAARYQAFRNQFIIPPAKLDAVFTAAINEARKRTKQHVALPEGESFTVEYVTNQPWGGYNWYQGGFHSLIQVNTDLPIFIDRAIDLAAHEGYPGHHVYNALLEKNLLRDRGWIEFSIYPLFSPQSLIAEGSANFGVEVAFPPAEQIAFERDVLFPLAGLDPSRAEEYHRVLELTKGLSFAGNEVARSYLNGAIDADEAARRLERYTLAEPARARKSVSFMTRYRTYVINYNHGQVLVRDYIEARAQGDAARRWKEFADLISSPRLPSGLK